MRRTFLAVPAAFLLVLACLAAPAALAQTPPDPPGAPIAQAGNTTATVTFTEPAFDGGSPITGYTVISSPPGGVDPDDGTTSLTRTITNLTNGVQYTFSVVATNVEGNSVPSGDSNPVRPALPTATIIVDSLLDDGVGCTLRMAIENANGEEDHPECTLGGLENTIVFAVNGTITLAMDGLFITDRPLTIQGNGIANTIVDGADMFRVFDICGCVPITVTLRNLTVTRGVDSGGLPAAGGLFVDFGNTVRIEDSAFTDNKGTFGGGAIMSVGTLEVVRTTFTGNSTSTGGANLGGAIFNLGAATIRDSTFSGNFSSFGGAIAQVGYTVDAVSLTIVNSTFSGNFASDGGGAIASYDGDAPITLTHTTVSDNTAGAVGGGGLYNYIGVVNVGSSVVAGNTTFGDGVDCFGELEAIVSQSHNVFGTVGCDDLAAGTNDFVGAAALLSLAANGGTTQTLKPGPASAALDRVPCSVASDQRGIARPQGASCDSGAFEVRLPGAPTGAVATGGNAQATVTFTAPGSAGDGTISGYFVASDPAGGVDSNAGTTATSHLVTGLVNGSSYTFTVRAATEYGQGPASAASNGVMLATVPGAPTAASAVAGNAQATVSFTPPVSDGGSAIVSYTVTSNPGGMTASGTASPVVVSGLANGTPYSFTVTATNGVGTGPASAASNTVTPALPTFGLTVTRAGTGGGTVTSSPAAIDCGTTCSTMFTSGTPVQLTAAPAAGSIFTGWSGDCAGTAACMVTMTAARNVTATFDVNPNPPRLSNIATRGPVQTGDNVMIAGFIISGSAPKQVLIRARGPSLTQFGVPNVLANPQIQLYTGQAPVEYNNDWGDSPNKAAIEATGFAPENAQEAAILVTLPPGGHTVIVSGVGDTTGVAIVEVFEVGAATTGLLNIATRGPTLGGDHVMIAGFIIQGDGPQKVLIRARGPSLTQHGVPNVLANPQLNLFSGQTVIASNDDWGGSPDKTAIEATGFAPEAANESAILMTLQPGGYTAIVTGVGGGTGNTIVEVFRVE